MMKTGMAHPILLVVPLRAACDICMSFYKRKCFTAVAPTPKRIIHPALSKYPFEAKTGDEEAQHDVQVDIAIRVNGHQDPSIDKRRVTYMG